MPARLLALLLCMAPFFCRSQNPQKIVLLQTRLAAATTDAQRIAALGALADHYYAYRLEKRADSILQKQLSLAEASHDKELVLATLFGNSMNNLPNWTSIETFERTLKFIEQGLAYAKELGRDDYTALAYIRKASLLRKRGQHDNALQQATLAFSFIDGHQADSIKATLHIELAAIYLAKDDATSAYKSLNNAFDIAYSLKNISLQSDVYHHLSELYQTLNDRERAKGYLLKCLELNTAYHQKEGLLNDYIDLARLTDNEEYIKKALLLSDSLDLDRQRIFSKKLLFTYDMVSLKNSRLALEYLQNNDDLRQSYLNVSQANYYWWIGNVYRYSNQPDSALMYYHKAEPEMEKSFDVTKRLAIYSELGACYVMLKQTSQATVYYDSAFKLAKEMRDISTTANYALQLSNLYAALSDYKKSYYYSQQYFTYKESEQKIFAARDVVLLEVERENKRRQKDADELAAKTLRNRNLQYVSITIAIIAFFVFMIVMGTFPISKFTIRTLGYFFFICLFEFVVLLIDTFLHTTITHGAPLQTWLIKIFLIALLVPFQHFLEHGLTKFLASHKLIRMRNNLSIKKWWQNMKKPVTNVETNIEEDTAVL